MDKVADIVNIGCAALDYIPGLTINMPLIGEFLYVAVHGIPQFPCDGFANFDTGIISHDIAKTGNKSGCKR